MDSHAMKSNMGKGQPRGKAKSKDSTLKSTQQNKDNSSKHDKVTVCHNLDIFHLPGNSHNDVNGGNSLEGGEISLENMSVYIDRRDEMAETNTQNSQLNIESKMPSNNTDKNDFDVTLMDNGPTNSNYFVYVHNPEGSQILPQVDSSGNIMESNNEVSQVDTPSKDLVPSAFSYFGNTILDNDKMRTSTDMPETSVTMIFDQDLPQQDPQQIFIDSPSMIGLNQSVILTADGSVASAKDDSPNFGQSLVAPQPPQCPAPDRKNFHSLLKTSQDLNNISYTNEVKFLPLAAVSWQHENKFEQPTLSTDIDSTAQDKSEMQRFEEQDENRKEKQHHLEMRSLQQSHLAHQTFLIQRRNEKEKVEISSLEDHLKGLGIDDSTPIFTSITAKVNPLLVTNVPGCQQFLMKNTNITTQNMNSYDSATECSFQGNITQLFSLHNTLKSFLHLKSQTNISFQTVEQKKSERKDKSVFCNLLVPYITSKGRIIRQSLKAKQLASLSTLDSELSGEEVNQDFESRIKKRSFKKRQNKTKLMTVGNGKKSTILQSTLDNESTVGAKSENSESVTENEPAGENASSVDFDDPLQKRLRQEQIKYKQIVDNAYKLRKLKSAIVESSRRSNLDQGEGEETFADKDGNLDGSAQRKKKGRPPKKFDPSDSVEKVHPRNPLTESESTKQQRIYEEHVAFKFFCNLCSFKTKRKSHFDIHMMCHDKCQERFHTCNTCDFISISLSALRRHELKHKKNLMRCDICNVYKTDKKHLLQRHIKLKHSNLDGRPQFKCDQCSAEFPTRIGLSRHTSKHIRSLVEKAIENTCHTCSQCQKDFRQRIHLHRHMRDVHGPEVRPHLCDKCGKGFKRTDALKQHKLVHVARSARKLPFECEECHKCFRSQAHLKEHMSMHTTDRPFLCHFCGAAFKTQPVQKKHILTLHIRPRTHVCSVCCRQFNTKNALVKHESTHKPPDEPVEDNDQMWTAAEKESTEKTVNLKRNIKEFTEKSVGNLTSAIVVNVANGTGVVLSNNADMRSGIVDPSEIGSGDIPADPNEAQPQTYISTSQTHQSFYYLAN